LFGEIVRAATPRAPHADEKSLLSSYPSLFCGSMISSSLGREIGPKPLFELFRKLLGHLAPDERLKLVGTREYGIHRGCVGRYRSADVADKASPELKQTYQNMADQWATLAREIELQSNRG
jgi:hypothetical protein